MGFTTLDELATWMLANIRLSRHDEVFINNLTFYTTKNNRITQNQNELFKKVCLKYKKQCNNFSIDIEKALQLNWTVPIVESLPEYTNASIRIENDKIILRSPFSKNFLTDLKKNPIYSLTWMKDKKVYEANYSLTILKQLVLLTAKHYQIINYCDRVSNILNTLSQYDDVKYWTPTLCYNNGYYYIASINESLFDTIKDQNISDDLISIADLVRYGVKINPDVVNKFCQFEPIEKVKVASNFILEFEITNVSQLINWLHEFGCDAIYEPRELIFSSLAEGEHKLLKDKGIAFVKDFQDLKTYKKPVGFYMRGNLFMLSDKKPPKFFKIIKLVNSQPIKIK